MKYRKKILSFLLCGILLICETACGSYAVPESSGAINQQGAEDNLAEQNNATDVISMEQTPVIDYIVPKSTPNILVGLQGYCVGENKEAVVKGKGLPTTFQVLDAESGQVIYEGSIEDVTEHEEQGISVGTIHFSDLETEGKYYIQCDIVGRSDFFVIRENLYEILLEEVYSEIVDLCKTNELTISDALMVMQAYEWYPEVFPDEEKNGVADILPILQKWVSYMEENRAEQEQEALYSAFLAKFGYHYRKIDSKYATDCLQRASTVLENAKGSDTKSAAAFFALTELYRATNHYKYRNQILEYKNFFESADDYHEQRGYLYGSLTYLVTRHTVDKGMCELFVNRVLRIGEEVAAGHEEMLHPVFAQNDGAEEVMKHALELSCANYVLNNYHYTNMIKEFMLYLSGRNLESVDYYGAEITPADYLLLLAQLVSTADKMGNFK